MVEKKLTSPTYTKENGLMLFNLKTIEPDGFLVKEKNVIYIPPLEAGGNHRHPRTEAFLAFGDLELIWQDKEGKIRREEIAYGKQTAIFIVDSMTPHAVKNKSKDNFGILIEFASEEQHDVEEIKLV